MSRGVILDKTMVILRLIHVLGGVFWAGSMIFVAALLEPSIRENGPDGGKVQASLMRRGLLTIMPIVAILVILSGFELLRRVSGGFSPEWFASPTGRALSLGMASALVAFLFGILVMRPAATKLATLGQAAGQLPAGAERESTMARIDALRGRMRLGGRIVASLLAISVVTMAVARYLQ
jgi:hypothetical protein